MKLKSIRTLTHALSVAIVTMLIVSLVTYF